MADLGFMGHESLYNFWGLLKKKRKQNTNIKLGTKVNIYLEREKKSQQISNLKMPTNTTNITKSRKIMY